MALILLLGLAALLLAGNPGHADDPAFRVDPAVLEDLGARFDRKGLRSVSEVLAAPDHPDHDWVRRVHERLARVGQGSGVVLYRTRRGAAVLLTAAHVLPYEALRPALPRIPACGSCSRRPSRGRNTNGRCRATGTLRWRCGVVSGRRPAARAGTSTRQACRGWPACGPSRKSC